MLFKCGHHAISGVGDWCMACINEGKHKVPKEKAPPTKEQKEITRELNRIWKRKSRGTVMGDYVIEHNGKWKRGNQTPPWDKFSVCHVYVSEGRAKHACRMIGYGRVMKRMETEEATIANWEDEQK